MSNSEHQSPEAPSASETPLSGSQYRIAAAGYEATVASVGGTLRELSFEGRPLILGFQADEVRQGSRGTLLAPWPNRVVGGVYTVDGESLQLPLNEAALGNALHGFALWLDWSLVERDEASVTLAATIVPTDAYPFRLALTVRYAVSADGLDAVLTARNTGRRTAPYGASTHPYFVAPGPADAWRLRLDAGSILEVDERLAPVGTRPVSEADPRFDLRRGPALDGRFIDNAYAEISPDVDGRASASLTGAGGRGVEILFGEDLPWAQVFTGALGDPAGPSVAIEPMTCPPNAFATGTDLIRIAPGASSAVGWTIRSIG